MATGDTSGFAGNTGGISQLFTVHNDLVTYGVAAAGVTLAFVGGGFVTLQGFSSAEANALTSTFDLAKDSTNTANFGTAGNIPSFS